MTELALPAVRALDLDLRGGEGARARALSRRGAFQALWPRRHRPDRDLPAGRALRHRHARDTRHSGSTAAARRHGRARRDRSAGDARSRGDPQRRLPAAGPQRVARAVSRRRPTAPDAGCSKVSCHRAPPTRCASEWSPILAGRADRQGSGAALGRCRSLLQGHRHSHRAASRPRNLTSSGAPDEIDPARAPPTTLRQMSWPSSSACRYRRAACARTPMDCARSSAAWRRARPSSSAGLRSAPASTALQGDLAQPDRRDRNPVAEGEGARRAGRCAAGALRRSCDRRDAGRQICRACWWR